MSIFLMFFRLNNPLTKLSDKSNILIEGETFMYVSASTYLDALFLLLGDNSDRSRSMVKEFLEVVDRNSNKKEIATADDEIINVYKSLIKAVIAENISQDDTTASKILLLKIKSNETIKFHPVERDLLTDVLTAAEPISAAQIDGYLKKLRNSLILAEIDSSTRKIFAKSRTITEIQDIDEQESEILKIKSLFDASMKSIEERQSSSDTKASETYVSLSDRDSIMRSLDVYMDRNVRGIIKTGLQGLNRALGSRGGFGLGETAVFAASSHNFKSGILVAIMIWTVIYNTVVVAPGKKALVYFVSLENEVNQNLMDVFRILYCRIEKRNVDPATLSVETITDWLQNYFSQFNVELFIDRYSPHDFSYGKFLKRFNAFSDIGYQMVLFDLDYMSEARGVDPGDTMSTQGQIQLIKENYLKFMNHAKSCGYLLTTGHQLTKEAEKVASQNRYAVKKFNPSMMADSSDVHRIIDILFYIQLENNVDGYKFLTMINRKNRGSKDTPERDKFFAYAFTEFGIEDDLLGLPQYVQDIDAWGIDKGATDATIVEAAMF